MAVLPTESLPEQFQSRVWCTAPEMPQRWMGTNSFDSQTRNSNNSGGPTEFFSSVSMAFDTFHFIWIDSAKTEGIAVEFMSKLKRKQSGNTAGNKLILTLLGFWANAQFWCHFVIVCLICFSPHHKKGTLNEIQVALSRSDTDWFIMRLGSNMTYLGFKRTTAAWLCAATFTE